METLEIQVEVRDPGSKQKARRLRRSGKIPGVLYGPKTQTIALELNKKEFSSRVAGLEGSHLVRLKSDATSLVDKVALVKEMQFHPITGEVVHADLYEVDLTAKIRVQVPLHFVGKAVGVVRGGILQPIVREIEVECLPLDIPDFFNVEVSDLDIGDSAHIEDLTMPEGIKAIYESNLALVAVVPPTVEEAPTPTAAPVEAVAVAPAAPEETKESES
ncbi:MAG: 50S ribosomal protein L25 [Deltaproteobacteria bacterium]|nr:50S ribosomal protein L25 [Deltaproteobacteria bacterium]MBI2180124.1 50S ribosomal protein L25 [Deltaproteobacteria bacterium]MBI2228410.1 50S ribosomal protein L25 [Deltaproteobacteria bacterium]MBI2534952.1 50S ribosomal protein L25 [Deltaproteobacteria bacterium]MBI3067212.1 50S ribosomal protein L25 [Deltaproteobacteria bacterium]